MAGDDDASASGSGSGYAVTLRWRDGREETVGVRDDETILEAAERAGVSLSFGCRTGACATCTARLCDGSVAVEALLGDGGVAADAAGEPRAAIEHVRPPRALKRRHLDDGYVLACVARPLRDCVLAVGTDVQAKLVRNPWK